MTEETVKRENEIIFDTESCFNEINVKHEQELICDSELETELLEDEDPLKGKCILMIIFKISLKNPNTKITRESNAAFDFLHEMCVKKTRTLRLTRVLRIRMKIY